MKKFIVGLLVGLFGGTVFGILLTLERAFRSPILVSAIRDALADKISMILYGEPVRRPTLIPPYGRYNVGHPAYSAEEVPFPTRVDAESALRSLNWKIDSNRGRGVTISDFYQLAGKKQWNAADDKWGWTSLSGVGIRRKSSGFVIDLPRPVPL